MWAESEPSKFGERRIYVETKADTSNVIPGLGDREAVDAFDSPAVELGYVYTVFIAVVAWSGIAEPPMDPLRPLKCNNESGF